LKLERSRDGLRPFDVPSKGFEGLAHARLQIAHALLQEVHLAQVELEEEEALGDAWRGAERGGPGQARVGAGCARQTQGRQENSRIMPSRDDKYVVGELAASSRAMSSGNSPASSVFLVTCMRPMVTCARAQSSGRSKASSVTSSMIDWNFGIVAAAG
jgi:hypothetical protein